MSSGSPRDTAAPPTKPNGIGKGVFIASIIAFVLSLVALLLSGSGYFTLLGQKADKIARRIPLKQVNPGYMSLEEQLAAAKAENAAAQNRITTLESTPAQIALQQRQEAAKAAASIQTARQQRTAAQAKADTALKQARAELDGPPAPSYWNRFQNWRAGNRDAYAADYE